MLLGRLAVGLIIFVLITGAIIWLYDATMASTKDVTGWAITLAFGMGIYCTVSGLYLLIHFGYL